MLISRTKTDGVIRSCGDLRNLAVNKKPQRKQFTCCSPIQSLVIPTLHCLGGQANHVGAAGNLLTNDKLFIIGNNPYFVFRS